jgi:hypothetical protein
MFQLKEDEAMSEVREWKRLCNESVAHLPRREALIKRLTDALESTRAMGLLELGGRNRHLLQRWEANSLLSSLDAE